MSEIIPFEDWVMNESANRYSVEVNYRTSFDEVKEGFAQLVLGFVSAALKNRGLFVKKVIENKPARIIVSNKNWNDGEWVYVLSYYAEESCFVITKGFYNKDGETVSKQASEKCAGHSAAELFKTILQKMEGVKSQPPNHITLKVPPAKTGPKKGTVRVSPKGLNLAPKKDEKLGS